MSLDYKQSPLAAMVAADLERLDADRANGWEAYEREDAAHKATKAALAAAEKRAEEMEARTGTLSGRVRGLGLAARNLALATPDRTLRAELERCARLCAEAESAPTQPQETKP